MCEQYFISKQQFQIICPPTYMVRVLLHCERFARPCLTVSKYRRVVALQETLQGFKKKLKYAIIYKIYTDNVIIDKDLCQGIWNLVVDLSCVCVPIVATVEHKCD